MDLLSLTVLINSSVVIIFEKKKKKNEISSKSSTHFLGKKVFGYNTLHILTSLCLITLLILNNQTVTFVAGNACQTFKAYDVCL